MSSPRPPVPPAAPPAGERRPSGQRASGRRVSRRSPRRRRSWLRRTLLGVLAAVLSVVVFLGAFVGGLLQAPFPSDASAPASGTAYLVDSRGHPYAEIKPAEQRDPLPTYADIGQTMVNAIVAAEDERYFSHGGVDPLAILRAAGSDLTGGDPSGASTITQQYVKNVYTNKQHTLLRKVKEAALAVRLDRAKSKQEILRLYLNSVYFGNNTYGVQAAAKFYFDRSSKALSCGQAAMLAGLVSAPSAHEPVHHFTEAKDRQHYVLDREVALKMLTPERATVCYDSVTPKSIKGTTTSGPSPTSYPEYTDQVTTQVRADLGADLLKSGNVVVETPLDSALQDAAQQALKTVLPSAKDPDGVVVGVNPQTGDVTTIATQTHPGYTRFGLDEATLGRQVSGSTVKPFTLAAALSSGKFSLSSGIYGPHEKEIAAPGCAAPLDAVNDEASEGGYFSLATGLAQSVNTVYAQLGVDVGLSMVRDLAAKAGVPTVFKDGTFERGFDGQPGTACPVYPSQSLGITVSPLDLATGYSSLVDGGTYHPQRFITSVRVGTSGATAKNGRSVALPALPASHRVISTAVSAEVVSAMRGVVTDGTAQPTIGSLPYTLTDLVGKTGTTQGESNAWFVGCIPTLCLAVWMGYHQQFKGGQPNSMVGVEGYGEVYGGTLPTKILTETFEDYQQNLKQADLPPLTSGSLPTPAAGAYVPPVEQQPSLEPQPVFTGRPTAGTRPTSRASASRRTASTPTRSRSTSPPPVAATSAAAAPTTAAAAPTGPASQASEPAAAASSG